MIVEIPHSEECNQRVEGQGCKFVPQYQARSMSVDGIEDQYEYSGAIEIPLTNVDARLSTGKAYVLLLDQTLHIFVKNFPVSGEYISFYFDRNRMHTADHGVEVEEDSAYVIGLDQSIEHYTPSNLGGPWVQSPAPTSWDAALGNCQPVQGPGGSAYACDAELSVELGRELDEPPRGQHPALGLAIADDNFYGTMPENTMAVGPTAADPSLDRRNYLSLIFSRPRGPRLRFMTWNVRRFSDALQTIQNEGFDDVDPEELAPLMYDYDVVALQELWSEDDADALFAAVNQQRATAGLSPMHKYGPINENSVLSTLEEMLIPVSGGLYIFSKYPKIQGDVEFFDSCKGIDCFKATGVQWVRLALNPPGDSALPPECEPEYGESGGPPEPGLACPPPPTTQHYVDVFNTHINSGSAACQHNDLVNFLLDAFTVAGALGVLPAWVGPGLKGIYDGLLNCNEPTVNIQRAQLAQVGQFVAQVTAGDSDHMSIVAGDFNANGRLLNNSCNPNGELAYDEIVHALNLVTAPPGMQQPAPDDLITPFPNATDWDIDHADVARERTSIDWVGDGPDPNLPDGAGTWVGSGGGEAAANCDEPPSSPLDCQTQPGDSRLDYIFVRPAAHPSSANYASPRYWIIQGPDAIANNDEIWNNPVPEVMGTCVAVGSGRVSDHRPVVADLEVVALRDAPPYHPDWGHEFVLKVTSYDGAQQSDCFLGTCSPIDPYVTMAGGRELFAGPTLDVFQARFNSTTCGGTSYVSLANGDTCLQNWQVQDSHDPSLHQRHMGALAARDEDTGSPNDHFQTVDPGPDGLYRIWWDQGVIELRSTDVVGAAADDLVFNVPNTPLPVGWDDFPIDTNDPVNLCVRDTSTDDVEVCVEMSWEEEPAP